MGSGAKSYLRKDFQIYEENFIFFLISVQLISVPFNNLLTTDCNAVFFKFNIFYFKTICHGGIVFTLGIFPFFTRRLPWEFFDILPLSVSVVLSFLPVCLWEGFCGVTVGWWLMPNNSDNYTVHSPLRSTFLFNSNSTSYMLIHASLDTVIFQCHLAKFTRH